MFLNSQNKTTSSKESKLLIIETSECTKSNITHILDLKDYSLVEKAFQLEEATKKLLEDIYDFIILDLHTSKESHQECIEEIQKLSNAKIILLTTKDDKIQFKTLS